MENRPRYLQRARLPRPPTFRRSRSGRRRTTRNRQLQLERQRRGRSCGTSGHRSLSRSRNRHKSRSRTAHHRTSTRRCRHPLRPRPSLPSRRSGRDTRAAAPEWVMERTQRARARPPRLPPRDQAQAQAQAQVRPPSRRRCGAAAQPTLSHPRGAPRPRRQPLGGSRSCKASSS